MKLIINPTNLKIKDKIPNLYSLQFNTNYIKILLKTRSILKRLILDNKLFNFVTKLICRI